MKSSQIAKIINELDLSIVDVLSTDTRHRYFRAIVQRQLSSVPSPKYFLKLALSSDSTFELLQREIQVLLILNELRVPAVQVVEHNAYELAPEYRYGLYEYLDSGIAGSFAKTREEIERLSLKQAHAVVTTLYRVQAVRDQQLASIRPSLNVFSWSFDCWYQQIVKQLATPVSADASEDRSFPTLEQALLGPDGQPFADRLLAFALSLEEEFWHYEPSFLVHGDLAPSNTYWKDDGIAIFLDWEWAGISESPWPLPVRGLDIANFYSRAWVNPAFGNALLKEFLGYSDNPKRDHLGLRAAFIDQTLNKLKPFYSYQEYHWRKRGTQAAFRAISEILYGAVTDTLV